MLVWIAKIHETTSQFQVTVEPGYIGLNRFLNVKAVIDISAFFNKEDVLASMCLPKCCVYCYTVMSKLENI